MSKNVTYTNQFKRDTKKVIKQGKNFAELENIVENLVHGKKLDLKHNTKSPSIQ